MFSQSENPILESIKRVEDTGAVGSFMTFEVPEEMIPNVGILDVGDKFINAVVERPKVEDAPSNLGSTGPYILPGKLFEFLDPHHSNVNIGEFIFQDGVMNMIKAGHNFTYTKGDYKWLTNGRPFDSIIAQIEVGLADPDIGPRLKEWLGEVV